MNRRAMKGLWIFEAVALIGCAVEAVKGWCVHPRCTECGIRQDDLETHWQTAHKNIARSRA